MSGLGVAAAMTGRCECNREQSQCVRGDSDHCPMWDEDSDLSDEELELAEAEMNCGEMPEGGCTMAGTEWCDWDCPFSDEMMKRANRRRK